MTINQIRKALIKNGVVFTEGFDVTISRDSVEVCVGYEEDGDYGSCNEIETEKLADLIAEKLGFNRRTYSGYGAAILSKGSYLDQYRDGGLSDPMHY